MAEKSGVKLQPASALQTVQIRAAWATEGASIAERPALKLKPRTSSQCLIRLIPASRVPATIPYRNECTTYPVPSHDEALLMRQARLRVRLLPLVQHGHGLLKAARPGFR